MKKVFFSLVCAGILATVACGPNEADKKAAEAKRIADSTHTADSIAAEAKKAEEAMATQSQDTIIVTDSAATKAVEVK